jgi:DNA-binding NtrC family response regulator
MDSFERDPQIQTLIKEEAAAPLSDRGQGEPEVPVRADDRTVPDDSDRFTLRSLRSRAEIEAIQQALGYSGWNRRKAACLLKISYRSLLLKIQQYKITPQTQ